MFAQILVCYGLSSRGVAHSIGRCHGPQIHSFSQNESGAIHEDHIIVDCIDNSPAAGFVPYWLSVQDSQCLERKDFVTAGDGFNLFISAQKIVSGDAI